MPVYEHWVGGHRVERVIPKSGGHDDIHVYGARVLQRQESGAVDGWYVDDEWEQLQADRARVADGKVPEVLDAVGDDPVKARAALLAEQSSASPRSTLIAGLQRVIDAHETEHDTAPAETTED